MAGLANTQLVGTSGHGLGGKIAILAAARDARIKASITFDAVDGSALCASAHCPTAESVLPLSIPIGFLGETLDSVPAAGFSRGCAPAAANYSIAYQAAASPSIEVTVAAAGYVSFVDSLSTCGVACSFCETPPAPQTAVLNIAHSYLVSFFERYLRGNRGYQTYLTGSLANQLFVATNEVSITSK